MRIKNKSALKKYKRAKKTTLSFLYDYRWLIGSFVALIIVLLSLAVSVWYLSKPPVDFPEDSIVEIKEGATLSEITSSLAQGNIIRSKLLFHITVLLANGERGVIAGSYYFEKPVPVLDVAQRFLNGDHRTDPWRVTIPEGTTTFEIAELLRDKIPNFDPVVFLRYTQPYRGYLFPDTYNFTPLMTEQNIADLMRRTFTSRARDIEKKIEAFGRPLEEVVVMASLLEEEASKTIDRRMIAGVLWNRIELDMPLQVDAAFKQVNGKNTYELTYDDLDLDNPFNTYKNKGLPPQPITNPGLDSLEAAITPIEHEHLYYLSERDGTLHFSANFEEHKRKKALYVR